MLYWYENNAHVGLCTSDFELVRNHSRTKDFYDIFKTWNSTDRIVFPTDISDPKTLMDQYSKSLAVGVPGKKIYFHPKSKFPRFKLCETSYKRCIKKGKEDFIIIGDIHINSERGFKNRVQTKDAYYLFPSFVYFRGISRELYQSDYSDIDFFIKKYDFSFF